MQSVAVTMQERAQRHVYRMAGVTEKVLSHLETMRPDSILDRVDESEKYERMSRHNYGLSDNQLPSGTLNLNVLEGGHAIVQVQSATARGERFVAH